MEEVGGAEELAFVLALIIVYIRLVVSMSHDINLCLLLTSRRYLPHLLLLHPPLLNHPLYPLIKYP